MSKFLNLKKINILCLFIILIILCIILCSCGEPQTNDIIDLETINTQLIIKSLSNDEFNNVDDFEYFSDSIPKNIEIGLYAEKIDVEKQIPNWKKNIEISVKNENQFEIKPDFTLPSKVGFYEYIINFKKIQNEKYEFESCDLFFSVNVKSPPFEKSKATKLITNTNAKVKDNCWYNLNSEFGCFIEFDCAEKELPEIIDYDYKKVPFDFEDGKVNFELKKDSSIYLHFKSAMTICPKIHTYETTIGKHSDIKKNTLYSLQRKNTSYIADFEAKNVDIRLYDSSFVAADKTIIELNANDLIYFMVCSDVDEFELDIKVDCVDKMKGTFNFCEYQYIKFKADKKGKYKISNCDFFEIYDAQLNKVSNLLEKGQEILVKIYGKPNTDFDINIFKEFIKYEIGAVKILDLGAYYFDINKATLYNIQATHGIGEACEIKIYNDDGDICTLSDDLSSINIELDIGRYYFEIENNMDIAFVVKEKCEHCHDFVESQ